MTEYFFIGLSTGASCLASCGNVVLSIMMSRRQNMLQAASTLMWFLSGRFLTYAAIAAATLVLSCGVARVNPVLTAVAQMSLGCLMIIYSLVSFQPLCLGHGLSLRLNQFCRGRACLMTALSGMLSSLNVCPPMISLVGSSALSGNVVTAFVAFFVGSSLFFLPLPLVGAIRNKVAVGYIGRASSLLVGLVFLAKGLVIIFS